MKTRSSLKNAKQRDLKNSIVVRRRKRLFVINKINPKIKYRQA